MADPTPPAATGSGLRHYVLVRHRSNWVQLTKFVIVGASGFVVNLAVILLLVGTFGQGNGEVMSLGVHDFHVREYHVYSMIAFAVANVSNYLLNRMWTFESRETNPWREYLPFLAIGLLAQAAVLVILTVLVHPAGFDMDVRVAQAIAIVIVTPLSYIGNKLWTFGSVRNRPQDGASGASGDDAP
jgi:putative flippase GtrA